MTYSHGVICGALAAIIGFIGMFVIKRRSGNPLWLVFLLLIIVGTVFAITGATHLFILRR